MPSNRSRRSKPYDASQAYAHEVLKGMLKHAKTQFGNNVKGFWFYDEELCPGCLQSEINSIEFKGQEALSLNAFIYRERGILIGYFLCRFCAAYIFEQNDRHPGIETPLHKKIEKHLVAAYHRHLQSLDA
jgi:hypothetical protein